MNLAQRKLAPVVIAASMALGSCAGRTLPPDPSRVVRTVKEERDWLALAGDITDPSQFKVWEPILEEMTGVKPVPSENVFFNGIKENCESFANAGGCYSPRWIFSPPKIFIEGRFSSFLSKATKGHSSDNKVSKFSTWVHEQGHHFDNKLGSSNMDMLIDQLEAVAFEHYFAEHIGKYYSKKLAFLLMMDLEFEQACNIVEQHDFYKNELLGTLEKVLAYKNDAESNPILYHPHGARPSYLSLYALYGSGRDSFGEVWNFIHSHSHEEVLHEIKKSSGFVADGIEKVNQMLFRPAISR